MAEVSGGGGKLPDEAFASHARRPNPSVDEHVAFPEAPAAPPAAPSALPQTAWAPRSAPTSGSQPRQLPPELAPELAQIPPEVAALIARIATRMPPRSRSHGRLNPVALALAAVAALALIMGSNTSVQPDSSGTGIEQGWSEDGVWYGGTSGGLELVTVQEVADATIQPVDQPRYEIPLGPSTVRIEVVGDDPAADVVVTSDIGDAQPGAVVLPFGAEVRLGERPDQFAVTASNGHGRGEIQCRVYADGVLVSIATGVGVVECRADPAR